MSRGADGGAGSHEMQDKGDTMITKKQLKVAARWLAEEARAAQKQGAAGLVEVADAALVEAGRRADARIQKRARNRAVKRTLKAAGKAAVVAGVAAAGVAAARMIARRDSAPKARAPRRRKTGATRMPAEK